MRNFRALPMFSTILLITAVSASTNIALAALCEGISPASDTPLTTVRIASGLARPAFATAPPNDVDRVFIVEQDGRIRILQNGQLLATPFLDIASIVRSPADGAGNEEGLLGLAFHPDYPTNGWFFVYHTDASGNNVVARYARSTTDPNLADAASRAVVITFSHPSYTNHNGGMIAFGPDDGHLYIGTGDGGFSCDPSNNSQNGSSNLGKLLRINVNSLPYTIPADNPFVGGGAPNDEIWALGLRNPWRWSFDRANSDLYIGDVGQGAWEEVDHRPGTSAGGENFGWDKYEGAHCPNPSCGSADCVVSNYVGPVLEYDHGQGCSITGGYVYRGCRMPALAGTYFYSDYCTEFIRSFVIQAGAVTDPRDRTAELAPIGATIDSVTSFGEDGRGEVLIVDRGGEVFKIVPVLRNMEASGVGARPLLLGGGGWSWENLQLSSSHPISSYRVYRSPGPGDDLFTCIFSTSTTTWTGDPSSPAPGHVFSYIVTAVNASGEETSPGRSSAGVPRRLSTMSCP